MSAIFGKTVSALRDADWLSRERAVAYCRILFLVTLGAALLWIALSHDGIDLSGKPLGTDFVSFWTASQIALGGHPAEVYDIAVHQNAQNALFGRDIGYAAFFYPPTFLLICLPLATLPYLWSLFLWLALTGFACYRVLRAWLGTRFGALPILAFPAMLSNLGHGQNAYLSAALFGGGALMLNTRPIAAGLCLGALAYKPHLAIIVPVALLAARRWRTLLAAAASAIGFCLASLFVFGADTWRAFLDASPKARIALEQNMVGDEKMQSVFAGVRLLHGGLTLAYGLQIVAALGVCAALVHLQRRSFRSGAEGPAMVAAALLASPFLLDYDLVLLAIPLAWIARDTSRTGFLPFEKTILAVAFILPAVSRSIAAYAGLPLAPLTIAAVLILILRRAGEPAPAIAPRRSANEDAAVQQRAGARNAQVAFSLSAKQ
ncbi:glycosyltransferase family 87 protein [Methylocapsa sp. S129]|uniref:glycosyltransferase family 87 protein n=1 Tax=Methylocapsa sp. S129 TaxID=1641869 RepID=UPI00131E5FAA|nr:glycosyltransferase family 87 protein [Methylocapsa sp. S129]